MNRFINKNWRAGPGKADNWRAGSREGGQRKDLACASNRQRMLELEASCDEPAPHNRLSPCCQLSPRQTLLKKRARTSNSINEQHSKGTLHVDGKNWGQCQICAFGKYENGFPLLEKMPAKSGRTCLRNLCRLTTPKESCDPLVHRIYSPMEVE